jgi:hypothetical protein
MAASREAARRRRTASPSLWLRDFLADCRLWMNDLKRPLPFAGGFVSAVLLFVSLAPVFPIRSQIVNDVPTRVSTEATLVSSFILHEMRDQDVTIDVVVDGGGRVVQYSIVKGEDFTDDRGLVRSLESALVLTRFVPATVFGQPQSGHARITIRRSQMEVRG